jgi:hypothetical protein
VTQETKVTKTLLELKVLKDSKEVWGYPQLELKVLKVIKGV